MHDEIGHAAGKIWDVLNTEGTVSTEILKMTTKLNEKLMNRAIGWLAREDKIRVTKKGNFLDISLTDNI